jgi:hypothetical protein
MDTLLTNKRILVAGRGGFIWGHLVKHLSLKKIFLRVVDIKPIKYWFQFFYNSENISLNDGLKNTYDWIYKMLLNKESAKEKFIKSSI